MYNSHSWGKIDESKGIWIIYEYESNEIKINGKLGETSIGRHEIDVWKEGSLRKIIKTYDFEISVRVGFV